MAAANSAFERRYSAMRQQVADTEGEARNQEIEALRRRFASMGALNSGAAVKTEQKTQDAGQRRLNQAYGALDINRLAEEQQMEETQKNREFATSERLGGQTFAQGERLGSQTFGAEQANIQRGYQTGERIAGQEFLSGEAGKQREYQTGERVAGQEYLTGENYLQRQFATSERVAGQTFAGLQLDKQLKSTLENLITQIKAAASEGNLNRRSSENMFNKEYDLNKEIAYYNMGGKKVTPSVPKTGADQALYDIMTSGTPSYGGGYPSSIYG